jgi:hypothetical protein
MTHAMTPAIISLIALTLIFGAALAGMMIQSFLPEHHLSEDSKTIIKAARSVVVGLSALTLGLLIATAKESFDTKVSELKTGTSKMIVMNRLLVNYGDKSLVARRALRELAESGVKSLQKTNREGIQTNELLGQGIDKLLHALMELPEGTAREHWLKNSALTLGNEIAASRWKIHQNSSASVSPLFLLILIFWLMTIFFSLGLIAPFNAAVIIALLMATLSMTGAILLTMELDQPYGGLIQISTEPIEMAIKQFK